MTETTKRPGDTTRSYQLVWKGNNPVVKPSNWAPGYTEGHQPTVEDAVKHGMHRLTQELSDMREKWLKISTMAMELQADADAQDEGTPIPDTFKAKPAPTEQVDHGGWEDR